MFAVSPFLTCAEQSDTRRMSRDNRLVGLWHIRYNPALSWYWSRVTEAAREFQLSQIECMHFDYLFGLGDGSSKTKLHKQGRY